MSVSFPISFLIIPFTFLVIKVFLPVLVMIKRSVNRTFVIANLPGSQVSEGLFVERSACWRRKTRKTRDLSRTKTQNVHIRIGYHRQSSRSYSYFMESLRSLSFLKARGTELRCYRYMLPFKMDVEKRISLQTAHLRQSTTHPKLDTSTRMHQLYLLPVDTNLTYTEKVCRNNDFKRNTVVTTRTQKILCVLQETAQSSFMRQAQIQNPSKSKTRYCPKNTVLCLLYRGCWSRPLHRNSGRCGLDEIA
jgi:hypothetical protein